MSLNALAGFSVFFSSPMTHWDLSCGLNSFPIKKLVDMIPVPSFCRYLRTDSTQATQYSSIGVKLVVKSDGDGFFFLKIRKFCHLAEQSSSATFTLFIKAKQLLHS